MAEPSPLTWTLRLKSRKTTVLLHIDPQQTFTTIKSTLYNALLETGLKDSNGTTISLPFSPADIQFGRPVNINDASQGFTLGEWEYKADLDEEEQYEGKGKGKVGGKPKSKAVYEESPLGAGLKDNAVLAFRWEGEGMWDGTGDEGEGDMWDVQLPSFDDQYGVTNEGDVGGRGDFEG